ncbi:hypothetical protein ACHAW5_008646 [Stephanodiscus triporus]|uniref:Folliculin n=1 Tax=Stephanodiscus triporus TaxID=2934178 RepID=A0ABD3MTC3_9STRA
MQFDVDVGDEDASRVGRDLPGRDSRGGGGERARRMEVPREDAISKTIARDDDDNDRLDPVEFWNWSPIAPVRRTTAQDMPVSDFAHDRQKSAESSVVNGKPPTHVRKRSGHSFLVDVVADPTVLGGGGGRPSTINASTPQTCAHNRHPSSSSSKGAAASNQPVPEGDDSTIDTELPQNSIFAATSEYIITGNELADQTITVSTHGMHILSSPTIIEDTRYERNSLLFAVGFVLRRSVDPRLFWPVLSNLSSTLRDMEVESEFLSNASTRSRVQIVLEDVLVSLNSRIGRCHLLLDDANLLSLQLFQPPTPPVPPVPDHAVPILLRPEWQLQMYDWDLTVNWIVPHIDGCKHVRQIAASTEVDMDMRVARQRGERKVAGGDEVGSVESNEWLERAFRYSVKSNRVDLAPSAHRGGATWTDGNSPNYGASNMARRLYSHMSSLHSLDLSVGNFSTARRARRRRFTSDDSDASPRSLPRSFPSRSEIPGFIREERSNDEDDFPKGGADGDQSGSNPSHIEEIDMMKKALAQIYSSCNRNETFGEMLLGKIETQMKGASDSKTVNAAGKDNTSIDWKLAFDYFDHRRLVTFGVVGGFLRRVHQFLWRMRLKPTMTRLVTSANRRKESIATNDGDSVNHEDDSSNNSSERHFTAVAEEAAVAAKKLAMDEMSVTASYPTSPLLQGILPLALVKRGEMLSNKIVQKEIHLRSKSRLLRRIAQAMDGTRCDDELSCMFELPIENLVEILQTSGRWDVISVFSCID